MARDRYKNKKDDHSIYIAEVIGRNYSRLLQLCNKRGGLFASRSYEDIFEDTIIYVIHDVEACTLVLEEDIIKHFCYRYRMIEFQTVRDAQQLKEVPYAYYLQAPEETE